VGVFEGGGGARGVGSHILSRASLPPLQAGPQPQQAVTHISASIVLRRWEGGRVKRYPSGLLRSHSRCKLEPLRTSRLPSPSAVAPPGADCDLHVRLSVAHTCAVYEWMRVAQGRPASPPGAGVGAPTASGVRSFCNGFRGATTQPSEPLVPRSCPVYPHNAGCAHRILPGSAWAWVTGAGVLQQEGGGGWW
jgi:hypothetical protein